MLKMFDLYGLWSDEQSTFERLQKIIICSLKLFEFEVEWIPAIKSKLETTELKK